MLKSTPKHVYHNQWWLWSQLSTKKSPLLTWKILGLLLNTLAAEEKYPVLNRENLMILIQMQLSQKQKVFLNFFLPFWNLSNISNILKQKMTLIPFLFPNLRTPKTWLDQYLKSPVSEELSTSNIVHVPKHYWNLHHRIFIIFIGPCQVNWVGESLSYWHAKFWYCLLTHWLPMKRILFLIETITR